MTNTTVSIPSGDAVLAGTYAVPGGEGPFPAALLIAGSGPLDRDGNHKRLRLDVSRLLAALLAEAGWASLRFDKRGVGASTGDYLATGFHQELDDAIAALQWLESRSDVSCVVPIGHSAGALFAAEMSARGLAPSGAVLLASTAVTGEATLVWQADQIADTLPGWLQRAFRLFGTSLEKQQRKALDKLAASTDDVMRLQGQKVNARWMREFIEYDPEPVLRATTGPLLAITGAKDVQVNPADLEVISAVAGERATTLVASDVDHLLRHEPEDVSNPKRYKRQAGKPLAPVVVEALLAWLTSCVTMPGGTSDAR